MSWDAVGASEGQPEALSRPALVAPHILEGRCPVVSLALGPQLTWVAGKFTDALGSGPGWAAFADCIGYSAAELSTWQLRPSSGPFSPGHVLFLFVCTLIPSKGLTFKQTEYWDKRALGI